MITKEWFYELMENNLDTYKGLNYNNTSLAKVLKETQKELNKLTIEAIRARIKEYFNENPIDKSTSIIESISMERAERIRKSEITELKRKLEYVISELDLSDKRYNDLLRIKEPIDVYNFEPSGKTSKTRQRATPIISLSDWHLEEKIERGIVNGFNEYNLKIAETRVKTLGNNILKLLDSVSTGVNVNDLCIWLGGDMISGYIHDELIENNNLSPLEAIRYAKRLLISLIEYLLLKTPYNLILPCSIGNHSRTTKKMQPSTGYKNNYEYMMYMDMQDYFQRNKRVKFHIPISDDCYITIFNKVNRFFHGDAIKYGGGIGGLSIPLIKYIHRKNAQMVADFNFLGHFHQLLYPTSDTCVNGSLIGLSAYGYKIGFKPEIPAQALTLLDEKRGYTIKAPIFAI